MFPLEHAFPGVPGALAIASSYPVVMALAELATGQSPLTWTQGLGLLLTVSGVIIVILYAPRPQIDLSGVVPAGVRLSKRWVGVVFALITALLWAAKGYAVAKGSAGIQASVANCLRMPLALAITFALGRLLAPKGEVVLPLRQVRASLLLLVFEAFGGAFFYTYGLANSPLVIGATLTSLAPVLAVPAAWILGLERLSLIRSVGVSNVVVGIWLLVR